MRDELNQQGVPLFSVVTSYAMYNMLVNPTVLDIAATYNCRTKGNNSCLKSN